MGEGAEPFPVSLVGGWNMPAAPAEAGGHCRPGGQEEGRVSFLLTGSVVEDVGVRGRGMTFRRVQVCVTAGFFLFCLLLIETFIEFLACTWSFS